MLIVLRTIDYLVRGERKNEAAIEEALRWRAKARELDERLFPARSDDGPVAAAEPRPKEARFEWKRVVP